MDNYFLSAFQDLQLNEAAFDIDDSGKVDELKSFVKDDIEAPIEEPIVDPNAEGVEDLQPDYVGKVIIRCNCCHSLVYKAKEDVHPNEDMSVVNEEDECPVCGNDMGFTVIGEIKPFQEEDDVTVEVEPKDSEVKPEEAEGVAEKLTESYNEDAVIAEAERYLEPVEDDYVSIEVYGGGEPYVEIKAKDEKAARKISDYLNKQGIYADADDEYVSFPVHLLTNESLDKKLKKLKEGYKVVSLFDVQCDTEEEVNKLEEVAGKYGCVTEVTKDGKLFIVNVACPSNKPVGRSITTTLLKELGLDDFDLKEDFSANIETDHDKINISSVAKEPSHDEEMIAPLSQGTEDFIEADEPDEESEEEDDDDVEEMSEVDEESFDEVAESFMKREYSDIKSYRTTALTESNNTLFVEGKIRLKSGELVNTKFKFNQAGYLPKSNKYIFEGYNDTFTSSKAFKVKGSLKKKKLMVESLYYRYKSKQLNESTGKPAVLKGVCRYIKRLKRH